MRKLRCEVHASEHCNLNCKGCYHFSPLAKEEFLKKEEWEKDCKRLSELYNGEMEFISLMGGEPLLNPDINELLVICRKNFPVGDVSIITNGILLEKMNEDFWKVCRENNVTIRQTKYPIQLDFKKIEEKAKTEKVKFIYFNVGERSLGYQPITLTGDEDAYNNYTNCYRVNTCIAFSHGKLYSCFIPAHIHHLKYFFGLDIEICSDDGVDIYSVNTAEEIEKRLNEPLKMCRYCKRDKVIRDGIKWEVSKRKIEEWVYNDKTK